MSILCRSASFIYELSERTVHVPQFIAKGVEPVDFWKAGFASYLPISAWLAAVLQVHEYISEFCEAFSEIFSLS